jgi:hypothetical protein
MAAPRRAGRLGAAGCWSVAALATGELAFYRCAARAATSLATLARVAGCRWRIEESFQATKGAGTKPAPGPVTTDDKPPSNHEHHEVPLEC